MAMNKNLIKAGYDSVAAGYLRDRNSLRTGKYLNKFIQLLPAQSHILDLGCGAGIPIAFTLIKKGHLVSGIDISDRQIALARKNCPRGDFQVKDISTLKAKEYNVDAVVSFYTIFHLPRTQHLDLLKKINSFLPKGGLIMITMGDCDFEGIHDFYGVKMWSSQYGPKKNREMLEQAGFEILLDEIDRSAKEKHQILMARKK